VTSKKNGALLMAASISNAIRFREAAKENGRE
jgi:hypothetical protein